MQNSSETQKLDQQVTQEVPAGRHAEITQMLLEVLGYEVINEEDQKENPPNFI